jgi:hypothetical protein
MSCPTANVPNDSSVPTNGLALAKKSLLKISAEALA